MKILKNSKTKTLTVLTIVTATIMTIVYALQQTFYSPTVTYQMAVIGKVQVWNGSNWQEEPLINWTKGNPWYVRFVTTDKGYVGNVTITWQLQRQTAENEWINVEGAVVTTNVYLSGTSNQYIYASPDGSYTNNKNWDGYVTVSGAYRVQVTFNIP